MKPRLTQTELALVERYRERPRPHALRWVGYLIYVFPSFLFAIIGLARADYVALLVAWGVLLGYVIFVLHSSHNEFDLMRGILRKLTPGAKRRDA